ncbi:interferon alpha-inducible protein 27-like protein 2B [Mercenaria mercenaria]|uniref:interferon alpha-inducible protein 27-like protein 2B n=1 Tax=Mercenaria mercenaria TaxID=6596 RepID=UPI00234EAE6A|nr:interferon alpha-inducible protein 27-like protein 2B [Mercenaria mercenaria]
MLRMCMARRVAGVVRSPVLLNNRLTLEDVLHKENLSGTSNLTNIDEKKDNIPEQNGKSGKHILRTRVLPAVALGGTAVVAAPAVLCALGFGAGGIVAGSTAASLMSLCGGTVSVGSVLAIMQSAGAAGIGIAGNVGIFSTVTLSSAGVMEVGSRIKKKIKRGNNDAK